ncbi:putative bifunctional diguanylate cyclase/phosphodiesterase [Spirilliplanes yamanashiensis]|uniref:Diguanylate cyclase/phosphodiesterase n=1 Tax=Spirilliplanes yamanashiensis TaxID=42233 RepID=A0A8J3YCJ1_9ACTN|nr:EAL domain-containing protein [Spirilliplanes yamanashiensis]MDP9818806.1 diguanylate cyclase (GGDEF)-like protein [Spirilliplanes yamanashiensis]GIJ05260.1 hypothetical protein Sya03_46120 [Spirilliplanes yamanashiensis]
MAAEQVQRLRVTPVLAGAVLAVAWTAAYCVVNGTATVLPPILGWPGASLATLMAMIGCLRVTRSPKLTEATRRLWLHLSIVTGLVVVATVSNAYDSAAGPYAPTQQPGPVTAAGYVTAMFAVLWALLRLPVGPRRRSGRLGRFLLDAGAVVICAGVAAFFAATRSGDAWTTSTRLLVPVVGFVVLGLVVALAFTKVAISGFGDVDRWSIRLLAGATLAGGVASGVSPSLVVGEPQLNSAMLAIPGVMCVVAFAADRQWRAAGVPQPPRVRRPYSLVPYAAVAATDGLLLVVAAEAGPTTLVVAAAVVALTALVVVRQVLALCHNRRLLDRVDANLVEMNRYQAELTHRANHDALTGLPNRALYEQESQRMLDGLAQLGTLGVALIDLDDFKAVNDRLGHTVGDMLLVGVAQRLRECLRRFDIVARLGGDEFALLLPGLSGTEAAAVLDRVQAALARPVHAAGHDLLIRASIGLAEARPGLEAAELLRRADLAMYAAKERGKGRYAVYDAELEQHHALDAQLGAELRQALDAGGFSLVYQPIVHAPDGEWASLETLVRWHHPERGTIPPDTFIRIAERTGLIVPLGDWIMRTACRQAADWLDRFGDAAPPAVAVNVSARQLREPGFAVDVAQALHAAGLAPDRLTVEVTETAVFEGGSTLDTLHALADLGVGIALDDFGTGHSSLGLLRTCPAQTLKLDKSFVDSICGGSQESVIAAALIQITDGLHLDAVAEGVETAEQAAALRRLGYRYLQGYLFARPMTPDLVEARLHAGHRQAA